VKIFTLTLEMAKSSFFDRQQVIDATDAATHRVLSKFGAFVRRRAKSSIRKRKRASEPGKPPSSHTGLLRDMIFFSFDREANSVVIGPTLINSPTGAPEILEYGGEAVVSRPNGMKVRIYIQPRPYMGPAIDAEKSKLPAMWADSIR
jgi:hypothetical protein